MVFSEDFLTILKNDPVNGTIELTEIAKNNLVKNSQEWCSSDYEVLIEAYALISEIIDSELLLIPTPEIQITGNVSDDCGRIFDYLEALQKYCISESQKLKLQSLRSHFKASLGSGFCYEFSQGDLSKIQALINQIRDLISDTKGLEKEHQQRLLKRLESLQSEVHKRMSDLDRFWGLIGDAGVVLGKLGTDAEPIVNRIREIADIVWQTQTRAEELPSGTKIPMLENKQE